MTLRVVIDPGVFVSAHLVKEGIPAGILRAWERGEFELIVSERLLTELAGVVARPKFADRISPREADEVRALLESDATHHPDPEVTVALTEDPKDDYLAALAETAGAEYLVTGDRTLGRWTSRTVAVVTPRDFLERIQS